MSVSTAADHLTVGAVARLAGISVRTLHHYDEIGLVVPGQRSMNGYRRYGSREINRLQEVLFFRELGFPLDEIKRIFDDPDYSRTSALLRQRRLVERKAERLLKMMDAIDHAIEAQRQGTNMTPEETLEVFGDFDPAEYEEEARERWGDTDAYQESAKRTASYTKQDWQQIQSEANDVNQAMLALMDAGIAATSSEAMELAEAHRSHISKWFYECTTEIHAGLGAMYVSDSRFKANIDKAGDGLAQFLSEAIAANAAR
ncbi:MAG: MerR family transcriptional regulator [Acidimicrobiia bacterium]|nr:MerR family transcriptional regulator [Acidimicrobiia bacterium]